MDKVHSVPPSPDVMAILFMEFRRSGLMKKMTFKEYLNSIGFKNPAEAVSELGQIKKVAGNHLKLYRAVPVEEPIVTRAEIEQYNAENEVEDFDFPLVEEYVAG